MIGPKFVQIICKILIKYGIKNGLNQASDVPIIPIIN